MFIEAIKLINLPIAAQDTLSKIGQVKRILVNPENGQVLGFLIDHGFLKKKKVLASIDITAWDPEAIITETTANLVNPEEIVKINQTLKQGFNLIDLKAVTESGKSLGHVENFLIDTETTNVVKYYLKDFLGKTRIMSADKVVSIDKMITFVDDEANITPGVTEAQIA